MKQSNKENDDIIINKYDDNYNDYTEYIKI